MHTYLSTNFHAKLPTNYNSNNITIVSAQLPTNFTAFYSAHWQTFLSTLRSAHCNSLLATFDTAIICTIMPT